jgi:hypothetical protein
MTANCCAIKSALFVKRDTRKHYPIELTGGGRNFSFRRRVPAGHRLRALINGARLNTKTVCEWHLRRAECSSGLVADLNSF